MKKKKNSNTDSEASVKGVDVYGVTWMNENLNLGHFQNGEPILEMKSEEDWMRAVERGIPAWSYYQNNPEYGEKYGKIYNVHVITDFRDVCPAGWRLPNKRDYDTSLVKIGHKISDEIKKKYNDNAAYSKYPFEISKFIKKYLTDLGFDLSLFESVTRHNEYGFYRNQRRQTLSFWLELPYISEIFIDTVKDEDFTYTAGFSFTGIVSNVNPADFMWGYNIRCVKK